MESSIVANATRIRDTRKDQQICDEVGVGFTKVEELVPKRETAFEASRAGLLTLESLEVYCEAGRRLERVLIGEDRVDTPGQASHRLICSPYGPIIEPSGEAKGRS